MTKVVKRRRRRTNKAMPLEVPLNLLVSLPMKMSLQALSDTREISMSDITRQALIAYLPMLYPEWDKLYEDAKQQVKTDALAELSGMDFSNPQNNKE